MALTESVDVGPSPVVELASGVDALYLSGRAELSAALFEALDERRAAAAEAEAPVPIVLADEEFGVEPRAFGRYKYRLVHRHGLVGVTSSEKLPTLRVQPRAEFLHAVGPSAVLDFFDRVGEFLAGGPVQWGLSRLDLFCDVQGWTLTGDDRHRFVCRGQARATHEVGEAFTGFEFGKRSSKTLCARIYDKTHQVERKGLDWWPKVWGERYDTKRPVLRVEFEIGRQGLKEFGVATPTQGLDAAARLWASASEDWLSYRSPAADSTKSRWPVSPQWTAVQSVSLRSDAVGLDRVRSGRRQGELRRMVPATVGYLATIGAIVGTPDARSTLAAMAQLISDDEHRRKVPFDDRVAERVAARTYQ
ncbi:MAG TPA: hypothetical protein VHK88_01215 [Aquihabitans sp.]|jgi:hypothetical protein|nr:hypothetical protein [Aquihabitans sp.]